MVPERPPPCVIMFGLGLSSAHPQINSSQLSIRVRIGRPYCCRGAGAWALSVRWVDVEVGQWKGGGLS